MRNSILKFLASLFLTFFALEIFLRVALFSPFTKTEFFRKPDLFGSCYSDDDYWKLYYYFNGRYRPPSEEMVHSLLGWSQAKAGQGNPLGLLEETSKNLDSAKNKILFYGDSFVKGKAGRDFEIPNYMNVCLKNYVIADLSCGGFGLDQMYLMFKSSYNLVSKPSIIFGVLVGDDIDRTILSVRTGQKPYFTLVNNGLYLSGIPIDERPKHYFEMHPPRIRSYLFRLVIRRIFARNIYEVVSNPNILDYHFEKISLKKNLSYKILDEIAKICKDKGYPLLFVLFYEEYYLRDKSWKEAFLKEKLSQLKIDFIDTKPVLNEYVSRNAKNVFDLYVQGDGHHNELGNGIIADSILEYLREKGIN